MGFWLGEGTALFGGFERWGWTFAKLLVSRSFFFVRVPKLKLITK